MGVKKSACTLSPMHTMQAMIIKSIPTNLTMSCFALRIICSLIFGHFLLLCCTGSLGSSFSSMMKVMPSTASFSVDWELRCSVDPVSLSVMTELCFGDVGSCMLGSVILLCLSCIGHLVFKGFGVPVWLGGFVGVRVDVLSQPATELLLLCGWLFILLLLFRHVHFMRSKCN